jgi:hypothetical protein
MAGTLNERMGVDHRVPGLVPGQRANLSPLDSVSAAEFVDSAGGIHNFLLASIKRMASGADVQADGIGFQRRTGLERITAAARHREVLVGGMYVCFHGRVPGAKSKGPES